MLQASELNSAVQKIGDDDSKEGSKHQHEGTVIKIYSAWKGVATTVRVKLRRTSHCAEICKCAELLFNKYLLLQQDRVGPWVCEGCSLASQSYFSL